jgi:hypothetical protein
MSPPDVTPAELFTRETKIIELPRPGAGGIKLCVAIGAVNHGDWWVAHEGIPTFSGRDLQKEPISEEEARRFVISSQGPTKIIAKLGIVSPPFSFGKEREPGAVWWNDLHPENQDALIEALRDLSGIGKASPDREAAERAARFPADAQGPGNSAAAGTLGGPAPAPAP